MSYEPENLERWSRPDSWMAHCDEWFYTRACFVFIGQNRDSDALARSNFECALRELGGESETVKVISESHWGCGWIEWIAIHESDHKALEIADELVAALSDYPVIDESHWSELEWNEVCELWESSDIEDRLHYMRDSGVSIFAARRDEIPQDDSGMIFDRLRSC